jgi:hypothetical protein
MDYNPPSNVKYSFYLLDYDKPEDTRRNALYDA